jgi:hypothetical protein
MFYNVRGGDSMRRTASRRKLAFALKKYIRLGLNDRGLDCFEVARRIEGSQKNDEVAKDLFAVWELCRILRALGKKEDIQIFFELYIGSKNMTPTSIAFRHHCDERTLYRRVLYVENQYFMLRNSL